MPAPQSRMLITALTVLSLLSGATAEPGFYEVGMHRFAIREYSKQKVMEVPKENVTGVPVFNPKFIVSIIPIVPFNKAFILP